MPRKNYGKQEAQPILAKRKNATLKEATPQLASQIGDLVATCLAQGNAVYVTPGRFGGIQFKVYIEGDQFAEYLAVNEELPALVEELLDALYDQEAVAFYRKLAAGRSVERPAKAPRGGIE